MNTSIAASPEKKKTPLKPILEKKRGTTSKSVARVSSPVPKNKSSTASKSLTTRKILSTRDKVDGVKNPEEDLKSEIIKQQKMQNLILKFSWRNLR